MKMQVKFLIGEPAMLTESLVMNPQIKAFFDADTVTLALTHPYVDGLLAEPAECMVMTQYRKLTTSYPLKGEAIACIVAHNGPFTLHITGISASAQLRFHKKYFWPSGERKEYVEWVARQLCGGHGQVVSVCSTVMPGS
jgi:hypothetical protein